MAWRIAWHCAASLYLLALGNAPGPESGFCYAGSALNAVCVVLEICRARALSESSR